MDSRQAAIDAAREASLRSDWPAVRAALKDLPERDSLAAEDLEALVAALWWLGDVPASMAVGEQAFRRLDEQGKPREAGMTALRLSLQWGLRADIALHGAWLARAGRLLAPLPEGPEHGYLAYLRSSFELDGSADPARAESAAAQVRSLARRHRVEALDAFALVLEGSARVIRGHVDEGFSLLDESLLPVVAGAVDPVWGGDIYCSVIHLSHEIGDYARMRAWTDALGAWCAPLSESFMYNSITQLHGLQLLVAEGAWDQALARLEETSTTLLGAQSWTAAEGFAALGDVLRLRGRGTEAASAYARASAAGTEPQPGLAYLAADAGRLAEGLDSLRAELAAAPPVRRPQLLLAAVELGLAAGEREAAENWAGELDAAAHFYGTAGLLASAAHAAALVALGAARIPDAAAAARRAAGLYRSQGIRHGLARAHEILAAALEARGDGSTATRTEAEAERATAAAIYRRLGAEPDVRRLDRPRRHIAVGPLTQRETEVLRYLMGGAGNRDIASALVLSDRTVARHLANIYTKLGVASRTAASAWAHDAGLQPPAQNGPQRH
ncbi:helix-turn-helix transcriptional regulator [Sinomonas halotolerans]|uniref:Helix-turn-helix transcriptional regulator n=1 Tax=Sinomonas halotolerans TaxID=1644133 RepID=A0ABU9X315_9MICC